MDAHETTTLHPAGHPDGPLSWVLPGNADLMAHLADPGRHLRLVPPPPAPPVLIDWEAEGWLTET